MTLSLSFEDQMRELARIDEEISNHASQLRILRDRRQSISSTICEHMEERKITDKTMRINNCRYKYTTTHEYQTLSFRYLETCLGTILGNPEHIAQIMSHIRASRSITEKIQIKQQL